jgi:hypothetical protein
MPRQQPRVAGAAAQGAWSARPAGAWSPAPAPVRRARHGQVLLPLLLVLLLLGALAGGIAMGRGALENALTGGLPATATVVAQAAVPSSTAVATLPSAAGGQAATATPAAPAATNSPTPGPVTPSATATPQPAATATTTATVHDVPLVAHAGLIFARGVTQSVDPIGPSATFDSNTTAVDAIAHWDRGARGHKVSFHWTTPAGDKQSWSGCESQWTACWTMIPLVGTGTYHVHLYVGKKDVAHGDFSVVPASGDATGVPADDHAAGGGVPPGQAKKQRSVADRVPPGQARKQRALGDGG